MVAGPAAPCTPGPDRLDDAGALVAAAERQVADGDVAGGEVVVGVAQAGGRHAHQHLALAGGSSSTSWTSHVPGTSRSSAALPFIWPPASGCHHKLPCFTQTEVNSTQFGDHDAQDSTRAAVAAASLVVAACAGAGGSDGGDGDLKIGAWYPLSGPVAASGVPSEAGARAYFDMLNADGGINGRKVDFISEDNAFDPQQTLQVARRMVRVTAYRPS